MKLADYLILAAVLIWFVLAVRSVVKRRGGCGCGGSTSGTCMSCGRAGCSTCNACGSCCSGAGGSTYHGEILKQNEEKMKNGD